MIRDIFFFTLKNSSTRKITRVEKKDCVGRRWVRSEPFALKYWEGGGERLALCNAVILFLGPLDIELQVFRVVWVFHSFVHTHTRHQIVYVKMFTASTLVGPFPTNNTFENHTSAILQTWTKHTTKHCTYLFSCCVCICEFLLYYY